MIRGTQGALPADSGCPGTQASTLPANVAALCYPVVLSLPGGTGGVAQGSWTHSARGGWAGIGWSCGRWPRCHAAAGAGKQGGLGRRFGKGGEHAGAS